MGREASRRRPLDSLQSNEQSHIEFADVTRTPHIQGPGGVTERRPLTHHEILGMIAPFTRRGRHVDLAASDRIARRLLFKPIVHEDAAGPFAGASESLQFDDLRPNVFRLTRTVTLATGETAKATTEGADASELLDRIETVPLDSHFKWVGDVMLARSYRLEPTARTPGAPTVMALASAHARLDGLDLSVKTSTAKGYPAEIELSSPDGQPLDLPEDLFATLGWDWRVLRRRGAAWVGTLRAPGREPERSRRIEAALEIGVAHLTKTLAEPPRRYHEKFVRARWGVVFRRMIPLLGSIALLAGALTMVFIDVPQDSALALMMFNAPPILLAFLFTMQEMPTLEIPAPPRPSSAPAWVPHPAREAPENVASIPDIVTSEA